MQKVSPSAGFAGSPVCEANSSEGAETGGAYDNENYPWKRAKSGRQIWTPTNSWNISV